MKSLPEYKKVKDKVCLVYLGPSKEFLVRLSTTATLVKQCFPELQVDVFAKDEYAGEFVKPNSALNPHAYGLVKQVNEDFDPETELGISQ